MAFGERPEKRMERLGRLKEQFPELSSFESPTLALQVNLRRSERRSVPYYQPPRRGEPDPLP